jgi:hypothetical protein
VQFVPFCGDAAFNLKIPAIDQCVDPVRVVVSENSNEFAQRRFSNEDASRQHRRALFVAAHETRCHPVQAVTRLADRQAAICLIDELRFAF